MTGISAAYQMSSRPHREWAPVRTLTEVAGVLRTLSDTTLVFLFFEEQEVSVQNLRIPAVTSIPTYRKDTSGQIYITAFSDENQQFALDGGKATLLLNHKPKISDKLPLTRAEKSTIGSTPLDTTADNNKFAEIEHSQHIDSLKNKRARKEAFFERLDREHTIQQRACKRKSAPEKPVRKKRQCSQCSSLTHDLRNCPDRRSEPESSDSSSSVTP